MKVFKHRFLGEECNFPSGTLADWPPLPVPSGSDPVALKRFIYRLSPCPQVPSPALILREHAPARGGG